MIEHSNELSIAERLKATRSEMAEKEETHTPASAGGGALEEGMFYERVFGPTSVEVKVDPKTGKRVSIVLRDAHGENLTIKDSHALRRFYHYLRLPLGLKFRDIYSVEPEKQQQHLNKSLREKPRELKFLFDENGNIVSTVTPLHKQISWRQVREAVENAITDVYGDVETSDGLQNIWSYRMPIENDKVSLWAKVHAGNNIIKGHSAVRISTRIRTEFDTASDGMRPPCLNWANLWQQPLRFFNIEVKRLSDLIETPGPIGLTSYDIHIKSTEISEDLFIEPLQQLKETAETLVIDELVEKAIKEPLSLTEMVDILDAYAVKAKIPVYIRDAILDKAVEEEKTVWGFSQAISWVRTHGELKKGRLPREQRGIVKKMENMAGEILSLAPTIADFHDKEGDITYEKLMGKTRDGAQQEAITISSSARMRAKLV